MWPFPLIKEPETPLSERPMPPCGNKEVHFYWQDKENMPCPECYAVKELNRKTMEENDYIDRLAVAIARELRKIL